MTTNGVAQYAAGANGAAMPLLGREPSVVMVNFGLKARHIYTALAAIPAGIGALATAGWLVLPATQTDLTRVETSLEAIRAEVRTLKDVNSEIVDAVRQLKLTVSETRNAPQALLAPRVQPRPKPAPKPAPGPGTLLGF